MSKLLERSQQALVRRCAPMSWSPTVCFAMSRRGLWISIHTYDMCFYISVCTNIPSAEYLWMSCPGCVRHFHSSITKPDVCPVRATKETTTAPGPPSACPFHAIRLGGTRLEAGRISTTTSVARRVDRHEEIFFFLVSCLTLSLGLFGYSCSVCAQGGCGRTASSRRERKSCWFAQARRHTYIHIYIFLDIDLDIDLYIYIYIHIKIFILSSIFSHYVCVCKV